MPLALEKDLLIRIYTIARLARGLDERMWVLNRTGRLPFVITGQGHEVAQAAIAEAFEPQRDWLVPFYRSLTSCLAFGMSARDLMLAQFARATDPSSGGRQMPGYYCKPGLPILSTSSPVATQVPHAAGVALALKRRGHGVVLTAIGEGSSNQGDVHEALNFASVHQLPLVCVIENNGYAISVPAAKQYRAAHLADRAVGYGMPGTVVMGSDPSACYAAAFEAVERARAGRGPTLIEAKVVRLTGHSSDDQPDRYRSRDELDAEREADPLRLLGESLGAAGFLSAADAERISRDVRAAVDDATEFAEGQPDPDVSTATDWVFAEAWPSERRRHRSVRSHSRD